MFTVKGFVGITAPLNIGESLIRLGHILRVVSTQAGPRSLEYRQYFKGGTVSHVIRIRFEGNTQYR